MSDPPLSVEELAATVREAFTTINETESPAYQDVILPALEALARLEDIATVKDASCAVCYEAAKAGGAADRRSPA